MPILQMMTLRQIIFLKNPVVTKVVAEQILKSGFKAGVHVPTP